MPWVAGSKLVVRIGMTGATGNIYCGLHEFEDMAFVLHTLRPSDLFLDVGANVGSYTVLASKVCGSSTISIEPDPGTANALRRNIQINAIDELVEVVEAALGAVEGRVEFTRGLDTVNHVAGPGDTDVREVQLLTLDAVVGSRRPTLLKLDVEGFEASVVAGGSRTLSCSSLLAVLTETDTDGVAEALIAAGFKPARYEPFSRDLKLDKSTTRGGAANALFVRDVADIRERVAAAQQVHVLGHKV